MYPGLVPKSTSNNEGILTIIGDNTNVPIIHTEPIIDMDRYDDTRVTYQDLMLKFTDLCVAVQNDQVQCRSVMSSVIEWTTKLRNQDVFELVFTNTKVASPNTTPNLETRVMNKSPVIAVTKSASMLKASRRYLSAREVFQKPKKSSKSTYSVSQLTSDTRFVPALKKSTRNCELCHEGAHGQFQCTKITCSYSCIPLKKAILK